MASDMIYIYMNSTFELHSIVLHVPESQIKAKLKQTH